MRKFLLFLTFSFLLAFVIGCGTNENVLEGKLHENHDINQENLVKNIPENEKQDENETEENTNDEDINENENKETTENNDETERDTVANSKPEQTEKNEQKQKETKTESPDSKADITPKKEASKSSTTESKKATGSQKKQPTESKKASQTNSTQQNAKPKEKPQEKPKEPTETVTVIITSSDGTGTILPATKVSINSGDTAMDATKKILKEKGIQHDITGSRGSAYVAGMANLYEEGLAGWHIRVNGNMIDRSAGAWPVNSGDTIHWNYTTNYLEDSDF